MQRELNEIVEKSLQKAYDHNRTGNVGKAYAYYTVVAELCPPKRLEIEEAFVDVLCMLLFYQQYFLKPKNLKIFLFKVNGEYS